ncbi:MAG: hypothetical protein JJU05_16850 [Verrucomicrobia bacterium]|nr:hypothetical protein [Verrucomicrobiota bacterium]MCH8528817.1 hypothetical protein [Kiritimatiellia bacterium]
MINKDKEHLLPGQIDRHLAALSSLYALEGDRTFTESRGNIVEVEGNP